MVRMSRVMSGAFGVVLIALFASAAAASGRVPGILIAPPPAVSASEETRVAVTVVSPGAREAVAAFDLVSSDGLVSVPVFRGTLTLKAGENPLGFRVPPSALAPFALGERIMLQGRVGPWASEADVRVEASPLPEASGWVLNPPPTALVYSFKDSAVSFRVLNPKNKPYSANLVLKFKNQKGKVVVNWKYPTLLPAGESLHTVTVPVAIGLTAKLKGALSLKTVLKIKGDAKTSGQSLLDWDFVATSSADKTVGTAPLAVGFSALASGGTAPYGYLWTFGDGTAPSAAQNPSHTYAAPGFYSATLVVTDARGGTISPDPILIGVQ
jgi:hypothetical protein